MFSAAPARASLVDIATITGRAFRRWLFAAMVTGVSAMECASFARVFPVHGAMISASSSFFGPMGSTASMLHSGLLPQISSAVCRCSGARPNRLLIDADEKEKEGAAHGKSDGHCVTSCSNASRIKVLAISCPESSGASFPGRPLQLRMFLPDMPGLDASSRTRV